MINAILDALSRAVQWLVNLVVTIINGIIDFARDVKKWFKGLLLKKGRHIPFLAKAKEFKELLKDAPERHVGIFEEDENTLLEGVFDTEDDTIAHIREIHSKEGVDKKTKDIIGDEKIVILS